MTDLQSPADATGRALRNKANTRNPRHQASGCALRNKANTRTPRHQASGCALRNDTGSEHPLRRGAERTHRPTDPSGRR